MNYRFDNEGRILLTISKGELINNTFESFCNKHGITFAWLNGLGALQNPEIGYYSLESKSYHKKTFNGDYELTSLIGNITIKDGKCFSHTHITFSDTNYRVFGGHLFDARITAAGEFIMIPGENGITRQMNSEIGLPLWCLENKFE
mgnify:CR=1 FL=1